jgi:hypothetical protein
MAPAREIAGFCCGGKRRDRRQETWEDHILRMNFPIAIAWLLAAGIQAQDGAQPFRLEPGDFRWVPFTVRQTPSEVDCHFEVVKGDPSVHLELLPMSEFRRFNRGREHDTMAVTPDGRSGDFRRIIDVRGQYAVVVENARGAPAATVLLRLQTNVNPGADVARTLSPARRLAVIAISFAFFFVTLTWSGRKLLRAMRGSLNS